jgi:hypothetical protein
MDFGQVEGLDASQIEINRELVGNYTYVCTALRMMHHSHGMDTSIIDIF